MAAAVPRPSTQGRPHQRRQSAHQPARHPDGTLRQAAFVEGEPVVQRPGDVGVGAGFAHAEQEADHGQRAEAAEYVAAHVHAHRAGQGR